MPDGKLTESAIKIHGLTKQRLKEKKARKWTKGESNKLVNFLKIHEDLPIVAHYIHHDRDTVLKGAFEKVNNVEQMPRNDRWRCTWEMCKDLPGVKVGSLNEVLVYY